MGRLIAIIALSVAVVFLIILHLLQRRRIRKLAQQMEDFLTSDAAPLAFSVREDALAPLHNAAAELENRLLLAREHHMEECRRTSTLTADISHQLKTPLASLRLFCEMDGGAHMADMLSQIERMERLICSLLRLERLCADGHAFTFAEHDVAAIVHENWRSLEKLYPNRQLSIQGSAVIRCDEKWLGEAMLNLLKNACEHTSEGGHICAFMERTTASFFLTLEDDGGGVAANDLPHLFERFYRAEGKEPTGAGIGLAIVQEIIRRHHGDVRAENTGKGLKMLINLPILNLSVS